MKTIYDILLESPFEDFEEWKLYLRQYDITSRVANALESVPQGTKYHPEFDALKHTWLVFRGIRQLGRLDLMEAALLHDYGKSRKTNIGKNRIYHFGHAKLSTWFVDQAKNHLKYYDLTRRIVEKHMNLPIGHKKLNEDKDLDDFITADKIISKSIYEKEATKTEKLKNKIKERWLFFKQQHSFKKVYIMIGIPGSGKSRYLKSVNKKYIVSPDNIRRKMFGDVNNQDNNNIVWSFTKIQMRIILNRYGKVYLDATNVNKWLRVEFMSEFNGAKKIAIVLDVDVETALSRINSDIKLGIDRAAVPSDVVRKMYKLFKKGERSLRNEFNKVIYFDDKEFNLLEIYYDYPNI